MCEMENTGQGRSIKIIHLYLPRQHCHWSNF